MESEVEVAETSLMATTIVMEEVAEMEATVLEDQNHQMILTNTAKDTRIKDTIQTSVDNVEERKS